MKILVTGGSKGLGAAIVRKLSAQKDDHIIFTYANSVDSAKKMAGELANTTALHCDFGDAKSIDELVARIPELGIDVLVNNAFINFEKEYFHKANAQQYLERFELNVMPTIKITQAAINAFRKKKFGKIINILSSANINKPPIGMSDYTANKSYILSLSKSWAAENIRFNITSNSISPGMMQTDFNNTVDPRIIEQVIESHPLKKLLTVEEVADAVSFLAKCSQHINGINMVINAGDDVV